MKSLQSSPHAVSSTAAARRGKPATAKVEKGPFKIEVVLSGVFEAQRMTEVSIRPKAWAMPLVVERAIELGTPVKKGDILVEFDREKIDKSIEDTEVENTIGDLALKQAEEELPLLEKALPVDLAAATRAKTQADEDLKKFFEIDKPDAERNAHFMVKQSVEFLEYAKEELRQLEKMYRSKDLTEETEEIILRRQRFQVESSEHYLKEAELQRDQKLKVDLPRQEAARPGKRRQAGDRPGESPRALSLEPQSEAAHRRQAQARPRQVGREARRPAPGPRGHDRSRRRPTAWSTSAGASAAIGRRPAATAQKLQKGGSSRPTRFSSPSSPPARSTSAPPSTRKTCSP